MFISAKVYCVKNSSGPITGSWVFEVACQNLLQFIRLLLLTQVSLAGMWSQSRKVSAFIWQLFLLPFQFLCYEGVLQLLK